MAAVADTVTPSKALTNLDEITEDEPVNVCLLVNELAPENVLFALLKALIFGFLITSISAYQGYITKGGSLEVGKASTNAVTNSCIAVLIADYGPCCAIFIFNI